MPSPATPLLDPRFLRKLQSLALVARRAATGRARGERASDAAGSGIAFSSHRPYAPGDDFRFVDWKLYARSERLYLKQFEEERDLTLHILLDCSGSMGHGDGAKFARAQELAAALGYIALLNLDRVALVPYRAEPPTPLTPLRGKGRALVLLRTLASLEARGATDLGAAARALTAHEARGGLALVISDGYERDGFLGGVDRLRFARVEPVVLLVVDGREATPSELGELTLIEGETRRERRLLVTERMVERHRASYHAHFAALHRALSQRHVRTVEIDVRSPLERTVLDLLRQRGVVG